MISFIKFFVLALSISLVSSCATPSLEESRNSDPAKRGVLLSGHFAADSKSSRRFTLENNLWGESAATSGSQTSQVTAVNGSKISWHTTFNWVGGHTKVKSYANLDLRVGIGKTLASITAIPAVWHWTYSFASCDLVADVSFDLWLSNTPNTWGASPSTTFEIMIWLSARGGARPIGHQVGTTSINAVTWKLFKGKGSTWTVLSFVSPNEITSFKQDLKPFFTFLINKKYIHSSQFLVQAQSGTEPFVGSATLTTTSYSISID